jgi:hypothetical protein
MASLAHKPVVDGHPPSGTIDSASWKQFAKGWVGGDVAAEGDHLRIPLCIADKDLVDQVLSGKREVSCGYSATISWEPSTYGGVPYDGLVTSITYDHVAIVERGRAGSARLGDAYPISHGGRTMSDTHAVIVDGTSIPTDPRVAAELEALRGRVAAMDALTGTGGIQVAHLHAALSDAAARLRDRAAQEQRKASFREGLARRAG